MGADRAVSGSVPSRSSDGFSAVLPATGAATVARHG